jgi:hypothetical protein
VHTSPSLIRVTMDSEHPIDVNTNSKLTSLYTGNTPMLDDSKHPLIKALEAAQRAHDNITFNLVVSQMPSDHCMKHNGINYVMYNPYRPKKSKRTAWYWRPEQSTKLINISKGIYLTVLYVSLT